MYLNIENSNCSRQFYELSLKNTFWIVGFSINNCRAGVKLELEHRVIYELETLGFHETKNIS
jgi:hypothetical protein